MGGLGRKAGIVCSETAFRLKCMSTDVPRAYHHCVWCGVFHCPVRDRASVVVAVNLSATVLRLPCSIPWSSKGDSLSLIYTAGKSYDH